MEKHAKTYRLPTNIVEQIEKARLEEGCTATEVVIRAVSSYCGGQDRGQAKASPDDAQSKIIEILTTELGRKEKELDEKNRQIGDLHRLLDQGQQLQLVNSRKALPEGEQKKPKKKHRKR